MPEYEIRLHKIDDALSIVMFTFAFSDRDAKAQAEMMLHDNMAYAHIWRDEAQIGSASALENGADQHIREMHSLAREMRQRVQTATLPRYAEKMGRAADDLDQKADGIENASCHFELQARAS